MPATPNTPKSLSCFTPNLVIYPSLFRCSSYVGRIGGKQEITVGNKKHRCKLGNIIHEIGHAVGFFHEQSRPDRDDFVKIVKENIKEGKTAFHFILGVGMVLFGDRCMKKSFWNGLFYQISIHG